MRSISRGPQCVCERPNWDIRGVRFEARKRALILNVSETSSARLGTLKPGVEEVVGSALDRVGQDFASSQVCDLTAAIPVGAVRQHLATRVQYERCNLQGPPAYSIASIPSSSRDMRAEEATPHRTDCKSTGGLVALGGAAQIQTAQQGSIRVSSSPSWRGGKQREFTCCPSDLWGASLNACPRGTIFPVLDGCSRAFRRWRAILD